MNPRIFAVVLGLVSAPAWSLTTVYPTGAVGTEFIGNGLRLVDGVGSTQTFIGRNFVNPNTTAKTIGLVEDLAGSVGGRNIQYQVARTILWGDIVGAAIALGSAAYLGAQLGSPIAKAMGYDSVQIGDVRCVATNLGWQCDEGEPGATVTRYRAGGGPLFGYGTSAAGACSDLAANSGTACTSVVSGISISSSGASGGFCTGTKTIYPAGNCGQGSTSAWSDFVGVNGTTQECGPVVDALNPAYSRPAGDPPGADGKCPTGRYQVTPDATVKTKLETYGDPSAMPELAADVLAKGQPIVTESPRVVSGPASATGSPVVKTTTNPDGTTTTTTTTTTNNYSYAGNTITYNTNVSTSTVNNTTGATTTTNTTQGADSEPTPDPCEANPTRVGCSTLTEVTGDPQWTNKPVDFAVDNLGLPVGCPPPRVMMFKGWELRLDYGAACANATPISLALQALAAVGCAVFLVRALGS